MQQNIVPNNPDTWTQIVGAISACWEHCKEQIVGFFLAMFGGVASWFRMRKNGLIEREFSSLVGHLVVAGFAGVMVYTLAKWAGMTNAHGLAFLVGMAGHGGGMVLESLDKIRDQKIKQLTEDGKS